MHNLLVIAKFLVLHVNRIFRAKHVKLVDEVTSLNDLRWTQALKTETIPFLVGLLETGLEAVDNMAATKAQIVKALKAMQLSLKYGDQVNKANESC